MDGGIAAGRIAKVCLNQGRYEDAVRFAKEGLNRDEKFGICHNFIGKAMEAQGDAKSAEAAYLKAFNSEGSDKVEAIISLARLCEGAGRLEEAVVWLGKGARGWPDDTRVFSEIKTFVETHGVDAGKGLPALWEWVKEAMENS